MDVDKTGIVDGGKKLGQVSGYISGDGSLTFFSSLQTPAGGTPPVVANAAEGEVSQKLSTVYLVDYEGVCRNKL